MGRLLRRGASIEQLFLERANGEAMETQRFAWHGVILPCLLLFSYPAKATDVCNVAFPGENTQQLLSRLPDALSACHGAATAVLFVGMNDAVNDKRLLRPDQTYANVSAMLKELTTRHVAVIVLTLHTPDINRLLQRHSASDYGKTSPNQRIDDTNQEIRNAATEAGARIADFHAVIERAGGATQEISTDGVHFNRVGYRLLAETVMASLPPSARTQKILCFGDSLTYGIGVRAAGSAKDNPDTYPQQLKRILANHL
jgi:lysophospholipase L1-like esterase